MSSSSCTLSPNRLQIVLGSSSASRRHVLEAAGYQVSAMVKPRIDEKAIGDRSSAARARDLVLLIGNAKADDVLEQVKAGEFSQRVILTGDQVVCWCDEIMEKPVDADEAKRFIQRYHLHPVKTVGSIVLTDCDSNKRLAGVDICTIHFSEIPEDVIDQMVAEGDVMYCCGALMIEHALLRPYINSIEGSEAAVRGIDVDHLARLMEELYSV